MRAIITDASGVDLNGVQSVAYDIVDGKGNVIVSGSAQGDVDGLTDVIRQTVVDYELKFKSIRRLKVGDEIN